MTFLLLLGIVYAFTEMSSFSNLPSPSPTAMPTVTPTPNTTSTPDARPNDEEAELTAFGFMLNFAEEDFESAYELLSENAREEVSIQNLENDLLVFVGVEDVPEMGVSVEDLQVSDEEAYLVVGMNYADDRPIKRVNLVVENGEWKVESVEGQAPN